MLHLQNTKSSALFVYILDSLEKEATGEAGKWWLHNSLLKLQHSLKDEFNINLIVVEGEAGSVIKGLIKKYKINEVIWNRLYSQKSINRFQIQKLRFRNLVSRIQKLNPEIQES